MTERDDTGRKQAFTQLRFDLKINEYDLRYSTAKAERLTRPVLVHDENSQKRNLPSMP